MGSRSEVKPFTEACGLWMLSPPPDDRRGKSQAHRQAAASIGLTSFGLYSTQLPNIDSWPVVGRLRRAELATNSAAVDGNFIRNATHACDAHHSFLSQLFLVPVR